MLQQRCSTNGFLSIPDNHLRTSFSRLIFFETVISCTYVHIQLHAIVDFNFPILELCDENSIRLFLGDDDLAFYHGDFNPAFYQDKDRLTRGRVEYCVNQTYHGLCGDGWDYAHASVVCRQLGFSPYGMLHLALAN